MQALLPLVAHTFTRFCSTSKEKADSLNFTSMLPVILPVASPFEQRPKSIEYSVERKMNRYRFAAAG